MKTSLAIALAAVLTLGAPTLAFAQMSTDESMSCSTLGNATQIAAMDKVDAATIAAATNVNVILVSECDSDTSSALQTKGAGVVEELGKNDAVKMAIQTRNATVGDLLGATYEGDTLTVYVLNKAS
jgi:predicted Fe-Mo cluster-binding NifX family protein